MTGKDWETLCKKKNPTWDVGLPSAGPKVLAPNTYIVSGSQSWSNGLKIEPLPTLKDFKYTLASDIRFAFAGEALPIPNAILEWLEAIRLQKEAAEKVYQARRKISRDKDRFKFQLDAFTDIGYDPEELSLVEERLKLAEGPEDEA